MIEALKHIFGICGDHWHPNIWTMLAGGFGFVPIFSYIRLRVKGLRNYLK